MKPQRYGPFAYTPINRRPKVEWPDGNHIALWIVPNIETFPLNEPVPGGTGITPDVINWAPRDYGARVGIFRMMEVMDRHGIRGTVALNSEVCDDYPAIIEDAMELKWEFMDTTSLIAGIFNDERPARPRRGSDNPRPIEAATGAAPKLAVERPAAELDYAGCLDRRPSSIRRRLHQRPAPCRMSTAARSVRSLLGEIMTCRSSCAWAARRKNLPR